MNTNNTYKQCLRTIFMNNLHITLLFRPKIFKSAKTVFTQYLHCVLTLSKFNGDKAFHHIEMIFTTLRLGFELLL